jgi:hypothetical protein
MKNICTVGAISSFWQNMLSKNYHFFICGMMIELNLFIHRREKINPGK